jgi:hypothetical protein
MKTEYLNEIMYNINQVDDIYEIYDIIEDDLLTLLGNHLLINLIDNHSMPGNTWNQIHGISTYYQTNKELTSKQRIWLIHTLKEYYHQLNLFKEYF